MRHVRSGKNMR